MRNCETLEKIKIKNKKLARGGEEGASWKISKVAIGVGAFVWGSVP